jgi:hypothetical protein
MNSGQPPCDKQRVEMCPFLQRGLFSEQMRFGHSFGTVELGIRKRWSPVQVTLLESNDGLVGAGRFERPTPCAQGTVVCSKGSIVYR